MVHLAPTNPRALISIGTNSTRLLVLRGASPPTVKSTGTRLGAGIDERGSLDPDARARTLVAIEGYVRIVRESGAALDVIATSALRRAEDADAFSVDVQTATGVAPRIITGDEEATYSYLGATQGLGITGEVGVLNVGGGSTELAVGRDSIVARTISLEIGAVRLSERFPDLLGARALNVAEREALCAQAGAFVDTILAPLAGFRGLPRLVTVGGTMFTAAGMLAQNPERDGVIVTPRDRRTLIDALLAADLAQRRAMRFIRPQRADILPGGLIVVDRACHLLGHGVVFVSHSDLLLGYMTSSAYRSNTPAPLH